MKLHVSIYGMRQSPKAWNDTIDKDLKTISLLPTAIDNCVYVKGSGGNYETFTLYVDDLLITEPNDNTVVKVHKTLVNKITTTDVRNATQILEINIIQNKEHNAISIGQAPYMLSLLDKCGMADCNLVKHTSYWQRDDGRTRRQPVAQQGRYHRYHRVLEHRRAHRRCVLEHAC